MILQFKDSAVSHQSGTLQKNKLNGTVAGREEVMSKREGRVRNDEK